MITVAMADGSAWQPLYNTRKLALDSRRQAPSALEDKQATCLSCLRVYNHLRSAPAGLLELRTLRTALRF